MPAALRRGRRRGAPAEDRQAFAGMGNAREVAACRHRGHRHRAWHATQRLQRLDHRGPPPGWDLCVACGVETREVCGVCGQGAASFGPDAWWCWGVTNAFRQPSARSRAPSGPARGAESVSEPASYAANLGVLKSAAGIVTPPPASPAGVSCDRGDLDGGERTRARQAGQWHGSPTGGVHPVPGRLGHAGGGHDPTGVTLCAQVARASIATRAGVRDQDQGCGLGWPGAEEVSQVTRARAQGAQVEDLGAVLRSDSGARHRLGGASHPAAAGARLRPG